MHSQRQPTPTSIQRAGQCAVLTGASWESGRLRAQKKGTTFLSSVAYASEGAVKQQQQHLTVCLPQQTAARSALGLLSCHARAAPVSWGGNKKV